MSRLVQPHPGADEATGGSNCSWSLWCVTEVMVSYFVKYTHRAMTLLTLVLFTSVLLEMKERSPLYWSLVSAISYLSARGRACMWPFISLPSSLPGPLLSSDLMEVLFIFQTLEECQLWSKGQWRYSHIVKLYRVMWTTWSRPTKMVLGIRKLCMRVQTSCARPPGSLQWIERWTWASEQFIALFCKWNRNLKVEMWSVTSQCLPHSLQAFDRANLQTPQTWQVLPPSLKLADICEK